VAVSTAQTASAGSTGMLHVANVKEMRLLAQVTARAAAYPHQHPSACLTLHTGKPAPAHTFALSHSPPPPPGLSPMRCQPASGHTAYMPGGLLTPFAPTQHHPHHTTDTPSPPPPVHARASTFPPHSHPGHTVTPNQTPPPPHPP
jgi:hypothetical protein